MADVVQPGSGGPAAGRPTWLWQNRIWIALGIACLEGILAATEKDFSKITIIVIAVPIILFYLLAGRSLGSRTAREVIWVLAASQAAATLVVILAFVVGTLALLLAAAFALVAIYLLLHDRPERPPRRRAE